MTDKELVGAIVHNDPLYRLGFTNGVSHAAEQMKLYAAAVEHAREVLKKVLVPPELSYDEDKFWEVLGRLTEIDMEVPE